MFNPTPEMTERDRRTAEAFAAPQVGDRFEELYSFWMYVVAVEPGGRVAVLTASPPCTLPRDGKLEVYPSHDAYRQAWSYETIPGFTVSLADRGNNVRGWFPGWPQLWELPVEPNDGQVRDRDGNLWTRTANAKPWRGPGGVDLTWPELLARGPLTEHVGSVPRA